MDGQNLKMTEQKGSPAKALAYRTTRMEAFSDGVFAIAITLLVLEIAVPAGSEDDLLGAVLGQWPSYLAYLVSFSTIGAVWLEHTVITEFLDRATSVLIRLNLLLLMVVSFSAVSDSTVGRVHRRVRVREDCGHHLRPQPVLGVGAGLAALALRGA
jgi:uncharacterized membrane protein